MGFCFFWWSVALATSNNSWHHFTSWISEKNEKNSPLNIFFPSQLFLWDPNGMFNSSYAWKLVLFYIFFGLVLPCVEAMMRMRFPGITIIGRPSKIFALKLHQRICGWHFIANFTILLLYLLWKLAILSFVYSGMIFYC